MFKETDVNDIIINPFRLVGGQWMLISAGDRDDFNTMTASWGGFGFFWNKPVAFVFIRPTRYTYEFVESCEGFTLSFFGEKYRSALKICGSKSGRDSDKIAEAGLTPFFTPLGYPAFEEAEMVLECKKMYAQNMAKSCFTDTSPVSTWYADGSFHKMYVAEILKILKK